jgi:YihY family inner membrane protein
MSSRSGSLVSSEDAAVAGVPAAGRWKVLRVMATLPRQGLPTLKYLARTEVHTYAFSVAANVVLCLFPFLVLLMTLVRRVFRSQAMYEAVVQLLRDYLPTGQDFVIRNLNALVNARGGVQAFSVVMLLITSTGVFLPLEVALNQVWGFPKNRSYLGNQLVSLALAVACGVLALTSVALTATNRRLLDFVFRGDSNTLFGVIVVMKTFVAFVVMKIFAIVATIAIFFLIYWRLPNGKVKAASVLPAAVVTGVAWEAAKYAYIAALPWLNFPEAYGPFSISVTLMFWAFLSGLLLLAGARLSAPVRVENGPRETAAASD